MKDIRGGRVKRRRARRRRGFNLTELIVACAIAVAAMVGIAQLMYQVSRQYQLAERRHMVALEAANIMEDLMSRPWDEITAEKLPAIELSAACLQAAPDAQLQLEIAPDQVAQEARRLTVRIYWITRGSQAAEPIQLVAWRYPS